MIYFAQLPGGSIKVGFTDNLDARMAQLTAHYGTEPALLATMPGDRAAEAEIHSRFAHLRIGRTEQFRPGFDLLAFIGKPLLVNQDPDVIEAISPRFRAYRLTEQAVSWARIASGYTGESMTEYVNRIVTERGKEDVGRLHAERIGGEVKTSDWKGNGE